MFNKNNSLKKFNTFGIDVFANDIFIINNINELKKILFWCIKKKIKFIFLGKGSNILLMENFYGIVIINKIKGIKIIHQNIDFWFLNINSGELLFDVINFSFINGIFGLENLSKIPGTIGSAVVNNIGAYGCEIKDFVFYVKVLNIFNGLFYYINNYNCFFSYRYSIFKEFLYKKLIIVSIILKIKKNWTPCLLYKDLLYFFNPLNLNIKPIDIYNFIINLRNYKLPNYKLFGNIGSIFKNPILNIKDFIKLKIKYFNIFKNIKYNILNKYIKISAALLIDKCGLKGYTIGGAKVYNKQPLIIINFNNALPIDIFNLINFIKKKVFSKFNILLELEIKVIFFNKFMYNFN